MATHTEFHAPESVRSESTGSDENEGTGSRRAVGGLLQRVNELESDLAAAERERDAALEWASFLEDEVRSHRARVAELESSPLARFARERLSRTTAMFARFAPERLSKGNH